MDRSLLGAIAVAVVVVLAGCGGAATGTTDGPTTDAPPTQTGTPSQPPATNGTVSYDTHVVDLGPGRPAIEGGLTHDIDAGGPTTYYATLLSGTDRINRSSLPETAVSFVEDTDFSSATVLAVQAFPKSSVPDYRVESVTQSGGRLDVRINDSAPAGTDDITLETVFVRVRHNGSAPSVAQITTQDGVRFDTESGVTTTQSVE